MNIKCLQLFIHLCDSKSFAKTASAMHISPSALSRQIQKLESDTAQVLFVRDNRSVELTPAAKKLLPVALNILGEWQNYNAQLKGHEEELKGEIRLFCSVTASYSHLPELLSEFRLQHPFIEFKLSTGDPAQAINKVLSDEVDIAISAQPEQLPARIEFETISEIPLSVIAPVGVSNFAKELQKEQPDWSTIPFIVPESGTARDRANAWFKAMKIKPNIYAQVSGHEAIVSMVALGCGVGIAPDVVINNSPVKEKIERLKVASIKPFKLGVCCKRSQLDNPLVKALWEMAHDTYIAP
ncbi:HTH-type transcriptional activator IlvY [Vibrio europaeus]|uniref:Transcriptional regulator n=4 Tax=Vibrio oreintalis group TaxID=1891919 RepID=F9T6Y8_9VIBR|nr:MULTISPECIES: HTH-type transcriptional activator IlvY [Vibrio oreintalis group]AIW15422.1 transcriptional regulator [Vibrio tubiashii ATCC 19109]EGA68311.1 DNA-binding transcriptional regulator IlvY [Vibrio sinaloensis DSM 21326]EGU54411.1 DNA-binding transcriptional regulator IlvY [Vibrio tubiashii ATCC 19109]EIF04235.1 DNA-binding transcriptional regulator IlvY [Vibrio tubiashii NCIMB 1337 = ATCC 19106]MCG9584550.1 HTH-type transcriptional activator IlvY [Vibrio tubiashii]